MQDDDDFDPMAWPELTDEEQAIEDEMATEFAIWWLQSEPDGPYLVRKLARDEKWSLACDLQQSIREFDELFAARDVTVAWLNDRKAMGKSVRKVLTARDRLLSSADALEAAAKTLDAKAREEVARRCREVRNLIAPLSSRPLRRIRAKPKNTQHRKLIKTHRAQFIALFRSFGLSFADSEARTRKIGGRYWEDNVSPEALSKFRRRAGRSK